LLFWPPLCHPFLAQSFSTMSNPPFSFCLFSSCPSDHVTPFSFVPHHVAWQAAPDDAEIFVRNIQDYVSVRFPFLELTEHHKQVSISRARRCSLRSPRNVRSAAACPCCLPHSQSCTIACWLADFDDAAYFRRVRGVIQGGPASHGGRIEGIGGLTWREREQRVLLVWQTWMHICRD